MEWPLVTIVTPTLNAANVLVHLLESISTQDYPKDRIEIIIADGGSTDGTVQLAKKYGAKVVKNEKVTSESGKATGIGFAKGKYIALLDSDNIMPNDQWLKQMIKPLEEHPEAIMSEPWEYTYRKEDGFITRYCALIGMNDPLVYWVGNYDRFSYLSNSWTRVDCEQDEKDEFIIVTLHEGLIPTIGANGSVFRKKVVEKHIVDGYLFDIDALPAYIKESPEKKAIVIKVKNGVVHTYCEKSINKFARKQKRRIKDFKFHKKDSGNRGETWEDNDNSFSKGIISFIISCITVVPIIYQTIKGYIRKPDPAWFFHPFACYITLWEYGFGTIISFFKRGEMSRKNWSQ